jgi:hypothetical protein
MIQASLSWLFYLVINMDFITAAHYAQYGYRIRRSSWPQDKWLSKDVCLDGYSWMENVLANDWEIITKGVIEGFPVQYDEE